MTSVDYGKGFNMTQDSLVNNILKTCDMECYKLRQTPTSVVSPLGNYSLGKDTKLQDEFKYASVFGMLMYDLMSCDI